VCTTKSTGASSVSTEDPVVDPESPPPASCRRHPVFFDLALVGVAVVTWGWLLRGLPPVELVPLGIAVPLLAALGRGVDRWLGGGRAWAGVAAMGGVGFAAVVGLTGSSPLTLAGFILGLVKPIGWTGDHLLLRVLPLGMVVGYPWRPTWVGALLSALGATAFLGIGLLILRSAG